jgi:IclR family acetate operon transcriptional repressor
LNQQSLASDGDGRAAREGPSSRSLSTARAVLQVLSLLLERPQGVRADEVAKALGKSTSTAYYLLTSLCEEGFAVHHSKGVYRPVADVEVLTAAAALPRAQHGFDTLARELFRRTRKRSYVAVVRAGRIEIVALAGRQGVRRMPGLGSEIRDSAHALAIGKVVLAELAPAALAAYISRGLRRFTPQTITTAPELFAELERVRGARHALDREEFDEDFCCIAAAVRDGHGRFLAALGLSVTPHTFDTEREELAASVIEVAHGAGLALPPRRPASRAHPAGRPLSALS